MRFLRAIVLGLASVPVLATAQNPSVLVKLDARIQFRLERSETADLRAYDILGRHSVVSLLFALEPGFDVTFSERFQRIEGDSDDEQLDEYFIEDKGYWRVGKQYVVFGRNVILRESVYAGRLNTRVGERAIPVTASYVDGDRDEPTGFVVRLGEKIGVSAAFGRRFGQRATSLTVIRRPEESPGEGRGHGRVIGIDFDVSLAPKVRLEVDHASFRRGETPLDERLDVSDVSIVWRPTHQARAEAAYTREWVSRLSMVRFTGEFPIYDGIALEPFLRFRNGKFYDAALTLRLKP